MQGDNKRGTFEDLGVKIEESSDGHPREIEKAEEEDLGD